MITLHFSLQTVEFRINKGVLGLTKELNHKIWEFKGPTVAPHSTRSFHDLHKYLQVPVMPPTLAECCKVIEIYYIVKVKSVLLQRHPAGFSLFQRLKVILTAISQWLSAWGGGFYLKWLAFTRQIIELMVRSHCSGNKIDTGHNRRKWIWSRFRSWCSVNTSASYCDPLLPVPCSVNVPQESHKIVWCVLGSLFQSFVGGKLELI